ncbi:MAG: FG-GAP-like repeat-containing protein [Fimbriimonadales bacterium]|nr:FG-GAP-like repeat-containing protein [Fimbriimonadales bacterium]
MTAFTITGLLAACGSDWPVYRHDCALSGVSQGKGRILSPRVKWEYYLGAPYIAFAADRNAEPSNLADLDGDGTQEQFHLNGKTIEVSDLSGKRLWSYTVSGHPLGGNVRVCQLFPDRKGKQIISFSYRMDTGEGQGYCFTFDKGVQQGELAWTTPTLTAHHAPMLIVDDVDGDGLQDIVVAPHYKIQIFNGQTGALKAEVPVAKGRNYGILLSRPRHDRPQKDIFVICDFALHVECVRYESGKWTHAWGHKYLDDENAPQPQGRLAYIRVGPNPVADLDGDGKDEMVYMFVDGAVDDQWRLIIRDCESGKVRAELPGVWLWSVVDLDGDGAAELIYTPTEQKRPPTYCELRVGRMAGNKLRQMAVIKRARPVLMHAAMPSTTHTIADEGLQDILRADMDGDGRPEFFYAVRSKAGRFEDAFYAVSLTPDGRLKRRWHFAKRGHRLNLIFACAGEACVRDLTTGKTLTIDAQGKVISETDLGKPGGFTTLPIVVDLDGDGRNEIVVQNAAGEIVALRYHGNKEGSAAPTVLWRLPGVAMNLFPGYTWNGALCPQAADVDGDGRPEVLFATEDEQGLTALVCVSGSGKVKWRRAIEGCPWGGLQAGIDHWTFGRFTGRKRGLDVYVDLHRRSKGSGEGWALRGDTGEVLWRRTGLVAKETAMPFGGGIPAVADLNGDGIDDLAQMFFTVYGAISGDTGEPLFPPAFLGGANYFGKWLAYSEPTVADLNGDGKLDVYLNSRSYARGGYAAVHANGAPLWAEFHNNDEGSDGLGPVGDFDGDGKLEIVVPVLNNTMLCLNAADGSRKWRIQTPVTGDVVAADVNGDGVMEILFGGRDGKLRAVSGKDGREVWSIAVSGQPIVADVDGDGWVEVLLVGTDGILRVIGE